MGGKDELDKSPYPLTVIDYLNKLCAYALSIGMTLKEYWEDDPALLLHYINAEEIRQRKLNNQLWLQGFYVYQAIGSLAPILNPFSKEHKARPYLKEPIPLTQKEIEEAEERRVEKVKNYLMSFVKRGG